MIQLDKDKNKDLNDTIYSLKNDFSLDEMLGGNKPPTEFEF
jgi:hypothetical protein